MNMKQVNWFRNPKKESSTQNGKLGIRDYKILKKHMVWEVSLLASEKYAWLVDFESHSPK